MSGVRRPLIVVGGLLVSAVALYLVIRSFDVGDAAEVLVRANPAPLLGILAVVAVQVVLRSIRWSILIPTGGGRRLHFTRLVPPMLVGYLGNAVLPARLGEPMRAVIAARRERIGTAESLGSVLVERVVDVATLAPVALVGALLVGAPGWATGVLSVTAAGGIAVLVVLTTIGVTPLVRLADRLGLATRPGIRSVVTRFVTTLGGPGRRSAILAAAGISVAAWFLDAGSFWLAARSVGIELEYPAAMLIAGIAVLGTAIPSAPGFVGTFELAAAGVAGALGVAEAPALAMAVLVHVMTLLPLAIGGAVSVVAMGANLGEVAREAGAATHD